MRIEKIDDTKNLKLELKESIINFLFKHLGEYGDSKSAIGKCLDYALQNNASHGGFVLIAWEEDVITGVTIINRTGMEEYIPENILVYIATHAEFRGRGIGKQLMNAAIKNCEGSIALHVEPDNPALHLYKKLGFTNKYLEMRYTV